MEYTNEEKQILLKHARNRAEIPLTIISIIFSIAFYCLIAYAAYIAVSDPDLAKDLINYIGIDKDVMELVIRIGAYGVLAIVLFIVISIISTNKSYAAISTMCNLVIQDYKGNEAGIAFEENCKLLGFKNNPKVFVHGRYHDSSLLGVKIRGEKAIGLEHILYINAIKTDKYDDLMFAINLRLAEIYLGHYNVFFQVFTFWARCVPLYKQLYSRVLSYSADNVATILMGKRKMVCCVFRETTKSGNLFTDEEIGKLIEEKENEPFRLEYISLGVFSEILKNEYPIPYFRYLNIGRICMRYGKILGKKESERFYDW